MSSLVPMEADFSFSSVKCEVWNSNVCVNWMNIFYLLSFWRHWPWSQVCCSQVWSVHVFSYGPRQSRGYQAVAWCHWYYLWLAAREGHWNWANIHCSCSIQKWEWIREAWQASGQPVANLRWLGKEVTWWQWGSKPRRLLEKGTTDEHERLLHAMSLWASSILPRVSVTSCSSLFLYWVPWNFKNKC